MKEGWYWYDDSKRPFLEKVKGALAAHDRKFPHNANFCLVNINQFEPVSIPGVDIIGRKNVLKNHFWVGVKGEHYDHKN